MKTNVKLIAIATLLFFATNLLIAQQTEKELKKDVSSKAMKSARKEAKKYSRDGYYVAPGAPLLDKQLENAWIMQAEKNDNNEDKYIVATGNSVAENQTSAKFQAMETAKLELAGLISTQLAAIVQNNIVNQQDNSEEAKSVLKTVAASENLIAQELGRVLTIVEMYKKIGKNIEANVRLAYDTNTAYDLADKVIRKSLEDDGKNLQEKLNRLLNREK